MSEENKTETKYVMVESDSSIDDDQINLLELIRTLLRSWKMIAGISALSTCLSVVYALTAPEVFKADALLASAKKEETGDFPMGQFGGLVAMAGIHIPGDTDKERVIATLQSRTFVNQFIEKKQLLKVLYEELWDEKANKWLVEEKDIPQVKDAVKTLQGSIRVENTESGLIVLSVYWRDPEIAAKWANELVSSLNEQLRQKAIEDSRRRIGYLEQELAKTSLKDMRQVLYRLLESEKQKAMLANVNKDFALEIIDPAVAPEYREKPKRSFIVILGCVFGGFLGIILTFILQFIQKMKNLGNQTEANA